MSTFPFVATRVVARKEQNMKRPLLRPYRDGDIPDFCERKELMNALVFAHYYDNYNVRDYYVLGYDLKQELIAGLYVDH